MSWAEDYSVIRLSADRRFVFGLLVMALIVLGPGRVGCAEEASQGSSYPRIELEHKDRILILAPHPDDEVLGCGGVIQKAKAMGLPIKIVFLTYGDNNQWSFLAYRKHPVFMPKAVLEMGLVRYNEAFQAAAVLGVPKDDLVFLGYPDFRTLEIWRSHWADEPPAKSMLTEVRSVPYANAFRPKAPHKGEEILKDLEAILMEFRPTKIFVSHPSDHNGDHQALYLFTRVALWDLEKTMKPVVYPYLVHFKNWPQPKGYQPDKTEAAPPGLEKDVGWKRLVLSPEEVSMNRRAIEMHHSQIDSSRKYLLSFIRADEMFGDFPQVFLKDKRADWYLSRRTPAYLGTLPEELIEEERVDFVGIEEEFLVVEDDTLIFNLKLSRPVSKEVRFSLLVFGYRQDRPFGQMPKIRVVFSRDSHKVYDQSRVQALNSVKVDRTPREIRIRLPLKALGSPQRILTSARTSRGLVPLDWVEWRVLTLSNPSEEGVLSASGASSTAQGPASPGLPGTAEQIKND